MIQVLLIAFQACIGWYTHPFHLSICEIEHDSENKSLQITSRIFQDDFEIALDQITQSDSYFSRNTAEEIEKELQQYFDMHLKINVDNRHLKHKLLGFEIEENVVWCYLEVKEVALFDEIFVQYSVLLETFNDQINLAHIRSQGMVKSLKFQKNQLTGIAAFTN